MNSDKKKIENIVRNRARSTSGRELMNFEHKEDAIEAETIAEDIEIEWNKAVYYATTRIEAKTVRFSP